MKLGGKISCLRPSGDKFLRSSSQTQNTRVCGSLEPRDADEVDFPSHSNGERTVRSLSAPGIIRWTLQDRRSRDDVIRRTGFSRPYHRISSSRRLILARGQSRGRGSWRRSEEDGWFPVGEGRSVHVRIARAGSGLGGDGARLVRPLPWRPRLRVLQQIPHLQRTLSFLSCSRHFLSCWEFLLQSILSFFFFVRLLLSAPTCSF